MQALLATKQTLRTSNSDCVARLHVHVYCCRSVTRVLAVRVCACDPCNGLQLNIQIHALAGARFSVLIFAMTLVSLTTDLLKSSGIGIPTYLIW
jgi:hypothetical protein